MNVFVVTVDPDAMFPYLTLEEAATRMGLSVTSVRRLVSAGKLVAVYPLGKGPKRPVLITSDSIRRHLAASIVAPTPLPRKRSRRAPTLDEILGIPELYKTRQANPSTSASVADHH